MWIKSWDGRHKWTETSLNSIPQPYNLSNGNIPYTWYWIQIIQSNSYHDEGIQKIIKIKFISKYVNIKITFWGLLSSKIGSSDSKV